MTDRLISLTVVTKGVEEWIRTFQDLSELTANLSESHEYVTLSSHRVDDNDGHEDCHGEHLYHDEFTMFKVRDVLLSTGLTNDSVTNVISRLQNDGILFRENCLAKQREAVRDNAFRVEPTAS